MGQGFKRKRTECCVLSAEDRGLRDEGTKEARRGVALMGRGDVEDQ